MKKLTFIVLLLLVSSCSYGYTKYGIYTDVDQNYMAKSPQKLELNYKIPMACSGDSAGTHCTNQPRVKKLNQIFSEYNLIPVLANQDDLQKPTLEFNDIEESPFIDGLSKLSSIFTFGIIPSRHKKRYEVIYTDNQYQVSNIEYVTEWEGWLIIPFSNSVASRKNKDMILDGLLTTTLNKMIEDKKVDIEFKEITKE